MQLWIDWTWLDKENLCNNSNLTLIGRAWSFQESILRKNSTAHLRVCQCLSVRQQCWEQCSWRLCSVSPCTVASALFVVQWVCVWLCRFTSLSYGTGKPCVAVCVQGGEPTLVHYGSCILMVRWIYVIRCCVLIILCTFDVILCYMCVIIIY